MNYSMTEVLTIAKAQKGVLWCVLVNLLCFVIPFAFLIVLPFQLYFIYKLASGLKAGGPVLWVIGMFIPVVSLFLLLSLSQRATKAITGAGFKVGLMGAKIQPIEERAQGEQSSEPVR